MHTPTLTPGTQAARPFSASGVSASGIGMDCSFAARVDLYSGPAFRSFAADTAWSIVEQAAAQAAANKATTGIRSSERRTVKTIEAMPSTQSVEQHADHFAKPATDQRPTTSTTLSNPENLTGGGGTKT